MKYQQQFDALSQLVKAATSDNDALSRAVLYLHDNFDRYNWVGVYLLDGENLVLGPWKGADASQHKVIPVGHGVCGSCALSCETEVVPDVNADARYLACFENTRSEIVVPIIREGTFWAQIDVDSDTPNAFSGEDIRFLEAAARLLADRG